MHSCAPAVVLPPCSATAVHESFEWKASADLSVHFSAAGSKEEVLTHSQQDGTVIIALVDRATSSYRSGVISRRNFAREMEGIVVGVLELSLEQLLSCGVQGRWCPLMAPSSGNGRGVCGGLDDAWAYAEQGAVGEVLVAFAWMRKGPAMDVLPRARICHNRVNKCRKRPREQQMEKNNVRGSDRRISKKRTVVDSNAPTGTDFVDRAYVEHEGNVDGGLATQETLVYIHVWDALVPRDRQGSALYLTLRLVCRGLRVQRVSTKPARGRGGLKMDTPSAGGSRLCSPRASPDTAKIRSREGYMHVVWDERLSLSVKGPVDDGAVIELQLRDASVDDNTAIAAREGEPFRTFAERNRPKHSTRKSFSSSSCGLKIPGPAVYRLRLQQPPGKMADESALSDSPSDLECSALNSPEFGGVEVRMAGLVLEGHGTTVGHAESAVKYFLQRRANVARTPGELRRPLRTVGGDGGSTSYVTSTLFPKEEKRRSRRRSRLLDLSAASGLFHQFAEDEQGESSAEVATGANRSPPAFPSGEEEAQPVQGRQTSCFAAPTLSKKSLRLVVQQCFPQYLLKPFCDGVHAGSSQRSTDNNRSATTTQAFNEPPGDLSFAEFVSWLRSLPQNDLGTAGLLVTPRTAIHHTGKVMDEDAGLAQELAATLELTRQPTAPLVRGWCSISLRSTEDSAALDCVRLGWVRGGGGVVNGDESAERAWRRHTKLLRRDVAILGKALAELEGRCARDPTITTRHADDNGAIKYSPKDSRGGVIGMNGGPGESDGETPSIANKELRQDREVAATPPPAKNGAAFARVEWSAKQDEPRSCSIVALYVGQQATQLGLAAKHLKEALRCAADALNLETTRDLDDQLAGHRYPCARSGTEKRWCGNGSPANIENFLVAGRKNEREPDEPRGSARRRLYGRLLQHIKQVASFQAEISEFQRRAGMLPRLRANETRPFVKGRQGGDERDSSLKSSFRRGEAPRSALALVKRIRRAQNAARRQASPRYPSAASGVVLSPQGEVPVLYGQGCADLQEATEDCGSTCGNGDARADWQQPQENALPSPICGKPTVAFSDYEEGTEMPASSPTEADNSPQTVFHDMLQKPPSLQKLQERLERARAIFRERAVDLPAAFASATTEQILRMARSGGKGRWEDSPTKLVPAAALCCPIDG